MTKSKNFIFFLMFLVLVFGEFLLIYTRYTNQNMLMENFAFPKTGNLMSLAILLVCIVFIILNMFSKSAYRNGTLYLLLVFAAFLPAVLFFANTLQNKDYKIFSYIFFLLLKLFMMVSLILVYFSSSKKIHVLNSLGNVLVISVILAAVTFYKVYYYTDDSPKYSSGKRKADAGVILGAAVWGGNRPSPVLRERINKGFEIYEKKYVEKLILTGGGSPNELTEAEVSKNELIKYGVDPRKLIIESKSNSTNEQILFVRDKFYKRFGYKSIIIVSDNFHLFRSSEMCGFNSMKADTFSSDTPLSPESNLNFCVKETFAVILFWFFGLG
ncbi:MAG: YdcF family protein [Ignavibacteria bacterium]|nr:YdcF family protein [Ignavibacteria bacterium]